MQFRSIRSRIIAGFSVVLLIMFGLLSYLVTVKNMLLAASTVAITARDVVPLKALEQVTDARVAVAERPDSRRAALQALNAALDQLRTQTPQKMHQRSS